MDDEDKEAAVAGEEKRGVKNIDNEKDDDDEEDDDDDDDNSNKNSKAG